jgi:pilus assembly protein CpaB
MTMNLKTWIPLALALTFGLVAALVGRNMLRRPGNKPQPETAVERFVVAKNNVDPGRPLAESDLSLIPVPATGLPAGAFRNPSEIAGRVVRSPLTQGQPVLDDMLLPPGVGGGPQALIPTGMRAITLEVNEYTGVAGLLAPGSRVDVVSTLKSIHAESNLARTIVQNVKVLAVGQRLAATTDSAKEPLSRSVTILVTPQQAEAVELASATGRTRLVLRNPLDDASSESEGATLATLTGQQEKTPIGPVPVLPVTRPSTPAHEKSRTHVRIVEIINGGQTTTIQIEKPLPPSKLAGNEIEP